MYIPYGESLDRFLFFLWLSIPYRNLLHILFPVGNVYQQKTVITQNQFPVGDKQIQNLNVRSTELTPKPTDYLSTSDSLY